MRKDRLEAFFDDVLSIIMTILVLTLSYPRSPSLAAFWELRESYAVYALSFFWIIAMWINLYRQWHDIERVSGGVLWSAALVLFFTSLVPYMTSFAGDHFYSPVVQGLYATLIFVITVFRYTMNVALAKANADNPEVKATFAKIRRGMRIDLVIKALGILLTIFVWPPLSMVMIFLSTGLVTIVVARQDRAYQQSVNREKKEEKDSNNSK